MKYAFLTIVAALLLTSCHTSRTTVAPSTSAKVDIFSCIQSQVPRPEWLSCSAAIDFESDALSIKLDANIRYRRDSIIWMNVKKMGFEVARVLITKDSVYLLNHIDNAYTVQGLAFLETSLGLPADFKNLENLLLGAPIWVTQFTEMTTKTDSSGWAIVANNKSTYHTDLKCRLIDMELKAKGTFREQLTNFGAMGAYPNFSYQRTIEAQTQQAGFIRVGLTIKNPEVDLPKTIRFDVPEHYKHK